MVEAVGKFANSVVTGTGSLRRNLLCWTCEKLGKRALLKMLLHAVRRDAFHGRIRYPDLYRWFDASFFALVEADYSCHSSIALAAGTGAEGSKDIDLWEGKKKSKLFPLGYMPVEA